MKAGEGLATAAAMEMREDGVSLRDPVWQSQDRYKQVMIWSQGCLERVKLHPKNFEASLRDSGEEGAQNRNHILAVLKKK